MIPNLDEDEDISFNDDQKKDDEDKKDDEVS